MNDVRGAAAAHALPPHAASSDPYEYSLFLGGPLFQLIHHAHLSGDALELLRRRVVAICVFAWVPLLVLAIASGRAWGTAVRVPFLADIEVHLRFLLALPLLIVAELIVHQRLRTLVAQFLRRDLIAESSRAKFDAAIPSALRLRNSIVAEIILIALVYFVGIVYVWPRFGALSVPTWYGTPVPGALKLSPAGWWYVYVSVPLFQFLLLRWYFRLFIWIRLLWQISRCELKLVPTHPDQAGGLGFLARIPNALAPLLAAHGVALAGMIANQIFYHGAKLPDFMPELAVVVGFLLVLVLAPLLLFVPKLAALKRNGLTEYGVLAQRYVREFDDKWMRGGAPAGESMLGSADIQSLADMSNSFAVVRAIKPVPITRQSLIQLVVITLLPVAPLALTMISAKELMTRLLKIVL
jgi:hypothetical protein